MTCESEEIISSLAIAIVGPPSSFRACFVTLVDSLRACQLSKNRRQTQTRTAASREIEVSSCERALASFSPQRSQPGLLVARQPGWPIVVIKFYETGVNDKLAPAR